MAKLTEICDFQGGSQPPKEEWSFEAKDGYIRMLQIRDFTQGEKVTPEYIKISKNTKRCNAEDILIARYGASLGKILTGLAGAYNVAIMRTIPDETKLRKRYLYYYLKSPYFQKSILNVGSRAAQAGFNKEDLSKLNIPCPDFKKQDDVVERLTKIEVVITARQQELQKLDELIKARFVEMFGDPVSNSFGLPVKKLSDLGSLDRGRSQHRPRNAPELLGGPYPLIQTGEVSAAGLYITEYHNTYSEIGLKQSKMWKAGTLCITIAANIAQTAIMTFDACFPDSVVGFVPYDEVNALYIHYWFSFFQKILEDQAPQVAQKNINLKILSNLNVVVPEKKTLKLFEDFVAQVDKSKVA